MKKISLVASLFLCLLACKSKTKSDSSADATSDTLAANATADTVQTASEPLKLAEPFATPSVRNNSKVIGWGDGHPAAPAGFSVTRFAGELDNPRWIYQGPNGDIFVAEADNAHSALEKLTLQNRSANHIILLRDENHDGIADTRHEFLGGLNKPFGMLIIGDNFYVANTDGVMKYPYHAGDSVIKDKGQKILSLPGGPRHWTRNIITNADHSKIYVAVGSSTDHAEKGIDKETRRANILEINPDGSGEKVYASGLRNPVGMDWSAGKLWTAVNERDELGDELVPDYLTSVRENGFYGWPYSYFGNHRDPRVKDQRKDSTVNVIIPEVPLGSHTASLGLAFYKGNAFPEKYRNGAFIGQHGSWNRSVPVGYKVVFVPFKNGRPGVPQDFLTGFMADPSKNEVHGRPVGIIQLSDGSLLVADDASNTIWRVAAQ